MRGHVRRARRRLACLALAWVAMGWAVDATAGWQAVETAPARDIPLDLGLHTEEDTGYVGIEAIAFLNPETVVFLDSAKQRLVFGRLSDGILTGGTALPLPGAVYPTDLLVTGAGGLVVLDPGASRLYDLRTVDPDGAPPAEIRTIDLTADLALTGHSRLAVTTDGQFAVAHGRGRTALETLGVTDPPRPTERHRADADYRFARTGPNAGLLRPAETVVGPVLTIETRHYLAHAALVGRDDKGFFHVYAEEMAAPDFTDLGDFRGSNWLVKYDRTGRRIGEAELPVAAFDGAPERFLALNGRGQALFLGVTPVNGAERLGIDPDRQIHLLDLAFSAGETATLRRQLPIHVAGTDEPILSPSRPAWPFGTGLTPFLALAADAGTLAATTRHDILARIDGALTLEWTAEDRNLGIGRRDSLCVRTPDPRNDRRWRLPVLLERALDSGTRTFRSIPYKWGGWHPDLAHFRARLADGFLTGDICTCGRQRCGRQDYVLHYPAIGMDCSGFVSYAWGTRRKYGTYTLLDIAERITLPQVAPGDALNKIGRGGRIGHIRMVTAVHREGDVITLDLVDAPASLGRIRRLTGVTLGSNKLRGGYRAIRRQNIVGNAAPLPPE